VRKKILFVHNALISFVARDLEILQSHYRVEEYFVKSDWLNPWRDFRKVYRSDLVFCWFASAHSLLPVLFAWLLRKPSVVVLGGYDVANIPEINYGHQRGGLRKWLTRLIFRMTTVPIAVSQFNYNEAIKNAKISPDKLKLIYNAVSINEMNLTPNYARNVVLTVGNVCESNLERKGLRLFVEAAQLMPDISFVVAGKWLDAGAEKLKNQAPLNVTFTGRLPDEELSKLFDQANIYAQLSRHEAFGVAVAEAMSYGCIPVLSNAGALPEVGGEVAFYIEERTPEAVAKSILEAQEALRINPGLGQIARQHIQQNFTIERRACELYKLLDGLLKN
jgi:glycosyltransferase involved in cell wall biosynthesis